MDAVIKGRIQGIHTYAATNIRREKAIPNGCPGIGIYGEGFSVNTVDTVEVKSRCYACSKEESVVQIVTPGNKGVNS